MQQFYKKFFKQISLLPNNVGKKIVIDAGPWQGHDTTPYTTPAVLTISELHYTATGWSGWGSK